MSKEHILICHKQTWPEQTSFYIFEKDGHGMIRILIDRDHIGRCWLSDLYVDPEYRDEGLGRALFEKAFEMATAAKLDIECCATKMSKHMFEQKGFIKLHSSGTYLYKQK